MRVEREKAQDFKLVAGYISRYLDTHKQAEVINLTNAGLYNVFDPRIKNISPMYVYWGYVNNCLYDDYWRFIQYLMVSPHDNLIISPKGIMDCYVPLCGLNTKSDFGKPYYLMVPGLHRKNINVAAVNLFDAINLLKISFVASEPMMVHSVIVNEVRDSSLPDKILYESFHNDIITSTVNQEDRKVIEEAYRFVRSKNVYLLKKDCSESTKTRLRLAFLRLLVNDNPLKQWTSFAKVYGGAFVYVKSTNCFSKRINDIGMRVSKNEPFDIFISDYKAIHKGDRITLRVRVNYGDGLYDELFIS